ncbi:helix-turn-helix domain-containing protein [Clostridium gasigenes]|uniref:helix-turn-helix transcriptional regulator n=1 Tax=Clostridium gasigenes TaxID=94869 RepID=UPI0016283591|nr:helix-turn-helix domain-containing protein [Clostridium gasigenes]MBB6622544.1 helix-turn-helix domain-containing protein [Clostridium gasigenes]
MRNNLISFRKGLSLSQVEMAGSLGISTSFYIKIELGERNPSFNFLCKFKNSFNCSIDGIFFA